MLSHKYFLDFGVRTGLSGSGVRKKVFSSIVWTSGTGDCSGERTDLSFDDVGGDNDKGIGTRVEKRSHNFVPDGRGAGDAGGDMRHRRSIEVADPGGNEEI